MRLPVSPISLVVCESQLRNETMETKRRPGLFVALKDSLHFPEADCIFKSN